MAYETGAEKSQPAAHAAPVAESDIAGLDQNVLSPAAYAASLLGEQAANIGIAYNVRLLDGVPTPSSAEPDQPASSPDIVAYDKQGYPLPRLREPALTQRIDATLIAPAIGPMGAMYYNARAKYKDGMSLACATPLFPYEQIVQDYADHQGEPGFSDVAFLDANFIIPEPDNGLILAAPGVSLDQYTLDIRPRFIREPTDRSGFDIELPYARSVAGVDRFSHHSFQWDGYHQDIGFRVDGRWDLILNTADNTEYEINTFDYALNGSAAFLATRPQLPYFSHEVSMLAEEYGDEALVRYLPAMEKEYQGYWMEGKERLEGLPDDGKIHGHRSLIRMPLGDGKFAYLNRFWDDADGPRLESYKEDVDLGERVAGNLTGQEREHRLKKLYKDIRAAAASGWDFSSRWFADGQSMETINTTDILPVDLNSLLARTEKMLSLAYQAKARVTHSDADLDKAFQYEQALQQRIDGINAYHWDPKNKIYRDFNFVGRHQTSIVSAAMSYPLYVGISNQEQTFGVAETIDNELLFPGGVVATTTVNSKQQWDGGTKDGRGQNNVWAPPNWATERGLARMGHMLHAGDPRVDKTYLIELAGRVKTQHMRGLQTVFDTIHTTPEKFRGDDPAVIGNGGEYDPVKGLGMSGETWRAESKWDHTNPDECLPIGSLATAAALSRS